jgi:hypothetical protein
VLAPVVEEALVVVLRLQRLDLGVDEVHRGFPSFGFLGWAVRRQAPVSSR